MWYRLHVIVLLSCGVGLCAVASSPACAEDVSFSRDVLPILSDRCFHCHGPDEASREAELRLDVEAEAKQDRGGHAAVLPNRLEASELWRRITSNDKDELMPPPDSHRKPLTEQERETIRRWILAGAPWGKHWSFESPVRSVHSRPKLAAIDAFVQRRLEQRGLTLSPPADKRTLIRRLALDLTGLPPTPEAVEKFLSNDSEHAYERLVDDLLDSSHYGERMAWPWLDAARYADTGGYQGDPDRSMWPWRDWVVRAMNDNMPFDEFTMRQIAGDLMPNATAEHRLATGFNRNHMHNSEGGRIAEETRVENVFDRVETTSTVWLGLTMQCARCHDHKFDPLSNLDYFSFYDFFNQTSEDGRTDRSIAVPPSIGYVAPFAKARLAAVEQRREALEKSLLAADADADSAQETWEQAIGNRGKSPWIPLQFMDLESSGGATLEQREDQLVHATGARPENDVYRLTTTVNDQRQRIAAIRLEALIDPNSPAKGTGRDEKGNFVLSEIELRLVAEDGKATQLKFAAAEADYSQGNYVPTAAIDGKVGPSNGWAVAGHTLKQPRWARFQLANPATLEAGSQLEVRLRFESQHTHHTLALFRLSFTAEASRLPSDQAVAAALQKPPADRTPEAAHAVKRYFRLNHWPGGKQLRRQFADLAEERRVAEAAAREVKVMVMDTRAKRRDTKVLVKGIYNHATDRQTTAATPHPLPALPPREGPHDRLDLARWLVSPVNPLTARVTVNRYWQTFFGRGLVVTPDDFGVQGAQPTHPDLLDWLAVEFIESGWNVKHIHRLIVTSQTYKQSARVTPARLAADPDNRWLSRSPRYRMPSWMLRDQALAASGLLSATLGGPPVKPYQPSGIWAEATFGKKTYQADSGRQLYRRSLYTFWRRIIGPTMFFDASKRQTCEVKPNLTNTPLHALTTLNETTYVEAARVLAERAILRHENDTRRLQWIFQCLTARAPEQRELELLARRLTEYRQRYTQDQAAASELLSVGESDRDPSLTPADHAAFTALTNMLFNLDEVLVRP